MGDKGAMEADSCVYSLELKVGARLLDCYRFDLHGLLHAYHSISALIEEVVNLSAELSAAGCGGGSGKLQKVFDHVDSLGVIMHNASWPQPLPDATGIRDLYNKLQRGLKLVSSIFLHFIVAEHQVDLYNF